MGKDPAFLFYPNDYLGGTMGMTFEEKGAYMDLLMLQFNRGHMTSDMIGQTVGQLWVKLQDKFVEDSEGKFYNVRLQEEQIKRKTFTESRKNNLSGKNQHSKGGHKAGHTTSRMENRNENEDKDVIDYEKIINAWNFFAKTYSISQIIKLSSSRKANVRSRLKEKDFDLAAILKCAEEQPFLLGKNKDGWSITFDWVFGSKTNYIKILKKQYKAKDGTHQVSTGASDEDLAKTVARRFERQRQ